MSLHLPSYISCLHGNTKSLPQKLNNKCNIQDIIMRKEIDIN